MNTQIKVCFLVDNTPKDNDAIYHWRVYTPVRYLKHYMDASVIEIGETIPTDTQLVVLPRMQVEQDYQSEALSFFTELREQGTKIVYDTDDDIFSEHYVSYMTQMYGSSQPDNMVLTNELIKFFRQKVDENIWVINQVDYITVTTETLADVVRQYTTKSVVVIPNAIDVRGFTQQLGTRSFADKGKLVIGWAGGARPIEELRPMLNAWERVAQQNPEIKFVISGWHPPLEGYEHFIKNSEYRDWRSVRQYANSMQFDIGCAIASDTPFARCKSPIKAWELALAGNLVIGSNAVYGNEPVLTCSSEDDWVVVLSTAIDMSNDSRKTFTTTYKESVQVLHDIQFEWWRWNTAYRQMVGDG